MKLRRFAPLDATHPAVVSRTLCGVCNVAVVAGDVVTLVPLRATDDPHIADCGICHVACVERLGFDVEPQGGS